MIKKTNINNIEKNLVKKKNFTKKELKIIILKSIINNKNINPNIRVLCNYKLSKFNSKNWISRQNNNICLKTGRIKGVYKMFNFSRHFIKKLAINNNLQNIKISSW